MSNGPSALISTEALSYAPGSPRLRILDASWHMPKELRDARAQYEAAHIPGAVFFDIDAVSDRANPYPHMLPSPDDFAAAVSRLGIGNDDAIVVYDTNGLFSAARVWWMFRAFGHDNVKVLDGGLPKWKAEGRALISNEFPHLTSPASGGGTSGIPLPPAGGVRGGKTAFHPRFQPALLRTLEQVHGNLTTKRELLLDARSPGRFSGQEPEPRPGLRSGHIEGSVNVFFKDVLSPPFNTLKKPEELRALFRAKAVDPGRPLAATCGSGVTACILALALYELGNDAVAVYDGAWAEWGALTK